MKQKTRSHFIYQDESGVVGTTGKFVVGLLFVKDRKPLYDIISKIRNIIIGKNSTLRKYFTFHLSVHELLVSY